MAEYTPEQIESLLDGAEDRPLTVAERAHLFIIARAYAATLRQQAGRVDEGMVARWHERANELVDQGEDDEERAYNNGRASALHDCASQLKRTLTAALAQNTQAQGESVLYVEARQCEDCDHLGINDASDTASACGDCEWQGTTPTEDKCPGCGHENCMAAACPICGGRYRFLADRQFYLHAECARVPELPEPVTGFDNDTGFNGGYQAGWNACLWVMQPLTAPSQPKDSDGTTGDVRQANA